MTSLSHWLPIDTEPEWADLVFHVLAHVRATRTLRASVFDATYVRFAEWHLGPASARHLAEDADVLGRCLAGDAVLAHVQTLAWLFASAAQAQNVAARDLRDLTATDVTDAALLTRLRDAGPAVELLRVACELEREHHAQLPPVEFDRDALHRALETACIAAPGLARCRVRVVRALRLRGRVRDDEIWIGAAEPSPPCSVDHVAWQAAHEATVRDVVRAITPAEAPTTPDIEHAALVLLAERAAAAGLAGAHAAWLANLHPSAATLARTDTTGVADVLVRRARQR